MRQVMRGSVDQRVRVRVIDSTTGAPEIGVVFDTPGVDFWYQREGGDKVALPLVTMASVSAAHVDGGFIHVGNGVCELCLPDAAVAIGADGAPEVGGCGSFTGMEVSMWALQLVGGSETLGVVYDGLALAAGSDATHIKLPGTKVLHPGMDIEVWAGTGAPWNKLIEAWDNGTRIATIAAVPTPADDTTVFRVWTGPSATDVAEEMALKAGTYAGVNIGALSAAGIQAIWDALTSALTTGGSIGKRIIDDNTAIKAKTDLIPATSASTGDAMTLTAGERISIAAAVGARTLSELGAIPGATPTADQAAMLPYMGIRNRRETTATTDKIHNDAGTVIATAVVSDDNITGTKGKYA